MSGRPITSDDVVAVEPAADHGAEVHIDEWAAPDVCDERGHLLVDGLTLRSAVLVGTR